MAVHDQLVYVAIPALLCPHFFVIFIDKIKQNLTGSQQQSINLKIALGYVNTKPEKFGNATFSPDRPSAHTKSDKFENGVFVTKTDKMFSVHMINFEEIATEIIWPLSRKSFQKFPFSPSTLTHLAGLFKFIQFGEHFKKVPFLVTENAVLAWTEGLSR